MAHQARVRVRGIYTTALTALLLEQGSTIVDASPAIQQRFGLPQREAPEDVSICDRRNRQGVMIEGEPAPVMDVVEGLQRALPQALVFPHPQDAQLPQENDTLRGDARRPLGARYLTEFPATVKDQLDRLRSRTVPTLPGHDRQFLCPSGGSAIRGRSPRSVRGEVCPKGGGAWEQSLLRRHSGQRFLISAHPSVNADAIDHAGQKEQLMMDSAEVHPCPCLRGSF